MTPLIPILSLIARAAGDDWFGQKQRWGTLFALPFGYAAYGGIGDFYDGAIFVDPDEPLASTEIVLQETEY